MSAEAFAEKDKLIGRYRLMQRLARGGMAELFLAKATGIESFEKIVVLKRILPHLADDDEFIRMFLREARLAATLSHPNIVSVHDIGSDEGEYFFTMEYLHGENLRHVIRRATEHGQKLPLEHAITVALGIAAGLDHAHHQVGFDGRPLGIVHRDVSPSNVIITDSGTVKVVDFGIATAAALTRASRHSSLKGKAAYMSPEQCRGARVDRRSDVFAIGLVLQELLVGHGVFDGTPDLNILHKISSGDIPKVTEDWAECPPALARILERTVQRDPKRRFQTAGDLRDALEDFAHEHRVRVSTAALGRFLRDRFGDRPYPWLDGTTPDPLPERPSLSLSPTPAADDARQAALGPLFDPTSFPEPTSTATVVSTNPSAAPTVDMPGGQDTTSVALDGVLPPQLPSGGTETGASSLQTTTAVSLPRTSIQELADPPRASRGRWWATAAIGGGALLGAVWFAAAAPTEPRPSHRGADISNAEPAAAPEPSPSSAAEPAAALAPSSPTPVEDAVEIEAAPVSATAQDVAAPPAEDAGQPPATAPPPEAQPKQPRTRRPRSKPRPSPTRAEVDPDGLLPY